MNTEIIFGRTVYLLQLTTPEQDRICLVPASTAILHVASRQAHTKECTHHAYLHRAMCILAKYARLRIRAAHGGMLLACTASPLNSLTHASCGLHCCRVVCTAGPLRLLAYNTLTCLFVLARGPAHPSGSSGRGGADYDPANIWGNAVAAQQVGRSTHSPSPPPQQHQHYQQQQQQQGMSKPPKAVVSVRMQHLHSPCTSACLLNQISAFCQFTNFAYAYGCCASVSTAPSDTGQEVSPCRGNSAARCPRWAS